MQKKLRPKVDVRACLGLNFKSPQNHTIWGSFEGSWANKKQKKSITNPRIISSKARSLKSRESSQPMTSSEARG